MVSEPAPSLHPTLLRRDQSAVLVIDVQHAFREYVPAFEELTREIRLLLAGAARLGVPVAATEQYPSGLGSTVSEAGVAPDVPRIAKVEFSACAAPGWRQLPGRVRDAEQFVVVGIEAHVCVRQTALALLAAGRDVHIPVDAVASHTRLHQDTALTALARAGAHLATVEQVLFDWLGAAGTSEFRDIQALLTQRT